MYYDGTKLLSLKDIDGNKPEIYITSTNRTAGKTTFFNRYLLKRFINHGEKFMLIFRFVNELQNVNIAFFKDIQSLFFPDYVMTERKMNKGLYVQLELNGEPCGYAVAINSSEKIKKISHVFSDVQRLLFDEFQSKSNLYVKDEVDKLISIHTSISRGRGKMSRYVPLIMCGNNTSLLNPYYTALGISNKLNKNTKYLRLKGCVVENIINNEAKNALENSTFNQAFNMKINRHESENIYLDDNLSLIEKINGDNKYICTLKNGEDFFSLRIYEDVIYCGYNVDKTFPTKFAVGSENIDGIFQLQDNILVIKLRNLFNKGFFRFKDSKCKETVIKFLSIR